MLSRTSAVMACQGQLWVCSPAWPWLYKRCKTSRFREFMQMAMMANWQHPLWQPLSVRF